jgi:alkylation response protein AidB-like acyl-CoA dehydrogenase
MFMTEQGAGSDVGATTTRAVRQPDGSWALTGDKWFCSNADAEVALVLARGGARGTKGYRSSCCRALPDGEPNATGSFA